MTTQTLHRGQSWQDDLGNYWTDDMDDSGIYSIHGTTSQTEIREEPTIVSGTFSGIIMEDTELGIEMWDSNPELLESLCDEHGIDGISGLDWHSNGCWSHRSLTGIFISSSSLHLMTDITKVRTEDEYDIDDDGDISF